MVNGIRYDHFWDPPSEFSGYEHQIGTEYSQIFLDGSVEFEPPPRIYQLFKSDILDKASRVIWISGGKDLGDFTGITIPLNLDIYFWPTFLITYCVHRLETYPNWSEITNKIKQVEEVQYKFISYNRKAHNHRCMLIDQFAKFSLIDKNLISWQDPNIDYKFKHFKLKPLIIDQPDALPYSSMDSHLIPPIHYKAFCNIIAESSTSDPIFITEKTAKALATGDIFLVLGARNFHRELEKMGFELYTEIFDYSFDSKDTPSRASGIIDNILNLPDNLKELTKLKDSLYTKRIHNHNRLIEIARNSEFIDTEVIELIKEYKEIFPKGNATSQVLSYLNTWNNDMFNEKFRPNLI